MLDNLQTKLSGIFDKLRSRGKITEDDLKKTLREIRLILLEADVNFKIVKEFIEEVEKDVLGKDILKSLRPEHIIIKAVNDRLTEILTAPNSTLAFSGNPAVIMLVGLQGTGKTTTAGKLGLYLNGKGRKCMLVPCDVKRPAAYEQLEIVAKGANVLFCPEKDADVIKVIDKAFTYAKQNAVDTLILDTAGRLHIDDDLMNELRNIEKKFKPCETIYVGDSLTGQDAVNSAGGFNESLSLTGIILTKMDGDQKGGAALSIVRTTGKPIKFICTGERVKDIEQFHPERLVSRILGMGDIVSLVEKTEQLIDEEEARKMQKKLQEGKFDFEDYLMQIKQLKKMGPLQDILKMMPGVGNKIKFTGMEDAQLKKVEAAIQSMTPYERRNPYMLNNKDRVRRIAKGSGNSTAFVKTMLKQHKTMKKMIMKMGKGGINPFNMPM